MGLYDKIPYWLPFDFTTVSQGTFSDVQMMTPHDLMIEEIIISNRGGAAAYRIQFFDLTGLVKLSDQPIPNGCLESDCRTVFQLPSPYYIPKSTKVFCRIYNVDTTLDVTNLEVNLSGTAYPDGYNYAGATKNPYMFCSFYPLGSTTAAGASPSLASGRSPLQWDFELIALSFDDLSSGSSTISGRWYAVQIIERITKKNLYRSPSLYASVMGGRAKAQLVAINESNPSGFPTNNCLVYYLPQPVMLKKKSQLSIRVYQAPLFASSTQLNQNLLDKTVGVMLLGNRILDS